MTPERTCTVSPSNIEITYQCFGKEEHPPLVLIMGAGAQLIHWPDGFIEELIKRELYVVRFDNRDSGLSTHFNHCPMPDIAAIWHGDHSSPAYSLSDMATDTVGLMDELNMGKAHVVGASIGGAIAQTMAIEFPERVKSLTCIMSSCRNDIGAMHEDARAVLTRPPAATREDAMERAVLVHRVIGSPRFPTDENAIRALAGRAYDRSFDPAALLRQAAAIVASGDREERLKSVRIPALVIQGAADKLGNISGSEATAGAIAGAKLEIIDGLGHDIPREIWPVFASLIEDHTKAAEWAV